MDGLIGKAFGPYTVVEKIGEGGMAVVYKGYQESLNRYVAIKVLRGELAGDQQFVVRFRREALAAAKLNHPNILHVYDAGMAHGVYYIVMDYAQGGTLKDLMMRGPIDAERAAALIAQVADALDYAHRQGLVHRDVKPTNILLSLEGRPLLTDFGIAKALYETTQLTRTGTSIGTPDYMAPEQIQGQPVDGRTDLYALGVVLYEMLSSRVPFKASTPVGLLYKHVNEPPPPLRSLNVQAPPWIEAVLDKALAKRPEDRFQRGGDFAEALQQQHAPVRTTPPPTRRATPPPDRRRSTPSPRTVHTGPARSSRGSGLVWILVGAIVVVFLAVAGVGAALLLGDSGQGGAGNGSPPVVTMVVTSQVVTQVVTSAPGLPTATLVAAVPTEPPPQPTSTPAPPPTQTAVPQPTVTPVYDVPSLRADVTELLFFDGPYDMPTYDERQYATRFAQSQARYISYELNLEFPEPGERKDFQVEAVYYEPDGTELARFSADYYVEGDWTTSWHAKGWGWDEPGSWTLGTHRVELYVEGKIIAQASFEIY